MTGQRPQLFDPDPLGRRCPTCRGTGTARTFAGQHVSCRPCNGTGRLGGPPRPVRPRHDPATAPFPEGF
jgi:hypothetical protein